MDFVKVLKTSRFLDPSQGFAVTERYSEVRYDPLTGHSTRILDFPIREVAKADLTDLIESSRQFCPFCPDIVEAVTPKFHPDLVSRERYARGESLCVPNAFPYDENGAVTVMSHRHYLSLREFTPQILGDALACCLEYLEDVRKKQPDMLYQSVNWNYMPLAGGSLIHPHLQIAASTSPTNYYLDILSSLEKYRKEHGTDFWCDYVKEEKERGERLISDSGRVTWISAFAPMGIFDILGIIAGASSPSDIRGGILDDLVEGTLNVMRFIDSMNMQSLNFSLYFVLEEPSFMPHIRICPRVSIPPYGTSQVNYMWMLHNETLTILRPEDICANIRLFWKDRER